MSARAKLRWLLRNAGRRRRSRVLVRVGRALRVALSPRGRPILLVGSLLICTLVLFSCLAAQRRTDPFLPDALDAPPIVRVGIVPEAASVELSVASGFRLVAPRTGAGSRHEEVEAAEVRAHEDGLVVGDQLFRERTLEVVPDEDGAIEVGGKGYRGVVVLHRLDASRVRVVNRLDLESYLAGVIPAEMPLAWPDPALRAQAVAARTYAVYQLRARTTASGGDGDGGEDEDDGGRFDLRADTLSQVYNGLAAETAKSRRLAEETRGLVLTWNNRIFCTFFHSTCGGGTRNAGPPMGREHAITPLSGVPCGFCARSRYYRWELDITSADLLARLRAKGIAVASVGRLETEGDLGAGYVDRVRVFPEDGGGAPVVVPADRFRLAVGASAIRSTCIEVRRSGGGRHLIIGRGWGHGVGLCQVGARGMADAGLSAEDILRHYYPGSKLQRMY